MMTFLKKTVDRLNDFQKPIIIVTLLTSVALLASLLLFHYQVIVADYPHEYREGAMVLTTQRMLDGANPFALSEQPQHTNFYGILYHMATYPLASIFGATLPVHRAVSGFFLVLCCIYLFLIMKREGVPSWLSFTGTVIYYGQLLSLFSVIARPDTLGIFLFFNSLFIPWLRRFDRRSLAISALFCVLAFFTKPYFVIGMPVLASYLFLFKNKKDSFIYVSIFAALFIVSALTANAAMEIYFTNNYFYYLGVGTDFIAGTWHVARQIAYFSFKNYALVLIFIFLSLEAWQKHKARLWNRLQAIKLFNLSRFDQPCLDWNFDFFIFVLLLTSFAFIFKLGQNTGGFVDYIYHLITPFMIIIVTRILTSKISINRFSLFGLFLLSGLMFTLGGHRRMTDVSAEWRNIDDLIAQHHDIYNEPAITSALVKQGKPVYDSGHSNGFTENYLAKSPLFPEIKTRLAEYNQGIENKIKTKQFDLVVLDDYGYDSIPRDLLEKYYSQQSVMPAPMLINSWILKIWVPKS